MSTPRLGPSGSCRRPLAVVQRTECQQGAPCRKRPSRAAGRLPMRSTTVGAAVLDDRFPSSRVERGPIASAMSSLADRRRPHHQSREPSSPRNWTTSRRCRHCSQDFMRCLRSSLSRREMWIASLTLARKLSRSLASLDGRSLDKGRSLLSQAGAHVSLSHQRLTGSERLVIVAVCAAFRSLASKKSSPRYLPACRWIAVDGWTA